MFLDVKQREKYVFNNYTPKTLVLYCFTQCVITVKNSHSIIFLDSLDFLIFLLK